MKKLCLRSLFVATVCFSAVVVSQGKDTRTPEEKAFQFRDGVFHALEWKIGQLAVAKISEQPDAFRGHASDMANLAAMISEGFVADSIVDGSNAKAELWENWDDFVERADALQAAAEAMTAEDYDIAEFDVRKFGGEHCGGCHRKYKERD